MSEHISKIQRIISKSADFKKLADLIPSDVSISGVTGSFASILIGELSEVKQHSILVVAPNQQSAEYIRDDLSVLYGEERVGFFPKSETHAKGRYFRATSEEFRVDALEKLISSQMHIVVADLAALSDPILNRIQFESQTLLLEKDEEYPLEVLIEQLTGYGYTRESAVMQPMELSVRGGILDVFPLGAENPIRLEFFGDVLESIRTFSITTQRSIELTDSVKIPPGLQNQHDEEDPSHLWDYLTEDNSVFWHYFDEISDTAAESDISLEALFGFPSIKNYRMSSANVLIDVHFGTSGQESLHGNLDIFQSQLDNDLSSGHHVYICCENQEQVFRLRKVINPAENQFIFSQELSRGFTYPSEHIVVYTDHQIYSRYKPRRTFQKFSHEEVPKTVDHLSLGDYLVHQDYGIGIYQGLQKVRQRGGEYECIAIEYQDGDKVFVPLQKFHRVQKYQGTEGTSPQIHKLGSTRWDTTKSKTRDAANEIAEDLVKLYGTRHSIQGYEFQKDTEYQVEMESAFLYDETEDQIRATEEVKDDMESKFPMDRLLIGDVGFGKTEVALRAAFKAVANSKQVGVLVPTTILAEQHFTTFQERLERFPVRIASLSRFRTKGEQKEILSSLKAGRLDIIIGTHRLLSKDVIFQDLGLVIIDEEHRFGVKHKEKLKQMTENIDVLSMTATPIPRTLQLSLSGARDLSKIETPPKERLPIYTEIASLEDDFIREVIMREINRGGQVYFVNNRIQNIRVLEKRLKTILPDLRFVVAHGRMNSEELEQVMVDFLHRKYDVLISTAIIESGIDIPNVNTIIINRADQMGLAQLYQLRGRVGRANRRAYAYLLVPSTHTMTDEARSRLQTLESFTHLGAGFQIAMKDLAMRGAGNMLGTKQSGFINSVGFDLYMEMVAKAIQEKQIDKGLTSVPTKETVETDISTAFETFIPEDYVPDPDQRIDLYRRISGALTLEELDDLNEEIQDRFGPLHHESEYLLESMRIKVLCTNLGITRLNVKKDSVSGQFIPDEKMQSMINYEMVVPKMLELSENLFIPKFVPGEQLNFTLKYRADQNQLNVLKYYLMELYEAVKFSA